jgi:hypothetical protein
MLTLPGSRWNAFSISMATVFLVAMLAGVVFAAAQRTWFWLVVLAVMSAFQACLIAFVVLAQRRNRQAPTT